MKSLIAFVVVFVWLTILSVDYFRPSPAIASGPHLMFCANASDGLQSCRVSLSAVAADPSEFHGRRIDARGFLAIDGGFLVLYTSRDALKISDRRQAIRIRAKASDQMEMASKFLGRPVTFVGKVDSTNATALQQGFMGDLREVQSLRLVIKTETAAQQSPSSLAYEIDDLD